ncbi:MAG: phage tail tube protein [Planctomycetaceae bacterium]
MSEFSTKDLDFAVEFSPGTYTSIANMIDFTPPTQTIESYDVVYIGDTHMRSIPTIITPGEVTVKVGYDPDNSTHTGLLTMFTAEDVEDKVKSCQITYPDPTPATFTFDAFVSSYSLEAGDAKSQLTLSVVMKISGAVVKA